jgi:hypothetical protein
MTDRRAFLRHITLASAALALKPAISAATPVALAAVPARPGAPAATSGIAKFARLEGATFSVVGTDQSLVLIKVEPLVSCHRSENFLVKFHGSSSQPLPEKLHPLHHPELGEMTLFLESPRIVEGECSYSAIFGQLT